MITIKINETCTITQTFEVGELHYVTTETINALMRSGAKFEIITFDQHNYNIIPRMEKK